MPKKCVPGTIICIGNMTLFLCGFLILVVGYLWVRVSNLGKKVRFDLNPVSSQTSSVVERDLSRCGGLGDTLTNPYVPPIRCNPVVTKGIPINIPTQSYNIQYAQIGILTRHSNDGSQDIIPLMGRRSPNSRDKWQYYTLSGGGSGGNFQTKLPVKVKGRSCSGEYGCDEIYDKDHVYVEGYQDDFIATIYESGLFSYLPF